MIDSQVLPADVKRGINSFSGIDDDEVTQAILTAQAHAKSDGITDKAVQPIAVIAYARHVLLANIFNASGGVISASAFGNSQTRTDLNKDGDGYLKEYQSLADMYGDGDIKFF